MKAILTAALLAATLVSAQATPMSEADQAQFINSTMLACKEELNNYDLFRAGRLSQSYANFRVEKSHFQIWSQTEISNYCGCYSATLANSYKQEDINLLASSGSNPSDMKVRLVDPAIGYCKKYLPLPDVSSIKNKAW
jgi:hypothetical protein